MPWHQAESTLSVEGCGQGRSEGQCGTGEKT